MSDERKLILQMLQEGKLTVDEAERLVAAMKETPLSGARPGLFPQQERNGGKLSVQPMFRSALASVDLTGVNLRGARLDGANLANCDLVGANLSEADLTDANLSGASLTGANLAGANLRGTDLSGADLSGVSLPRVNLSGLDLRGISLCGANLAGVDLLSLVRNLTGGKEPAEPTSAKLAGAAPVIATSASPSEPAE